jgi:hypothetical protein
LLECVTVAMKLIKAKHCKIIQKYVESNTIIINNYNRSELIFFSSCWNKYLFIKKE